jgi:hypothetical protein
MEIRGADRFWDMPAGYGPFNPFDRTFYRTALANCFVYSEFVQFGLRPGEDRWMNALIEQHLATFSTKFHSLAEVVKFFSSKNVSEFKNTKPVLCARSRESAHLTYVNAVHYFAGTLVTIRNTSFAYVLRRKYGDISGKEVKEIPRFNRN